MKKKPLIITLGTLFVSAAIIVPSVTMFYINDKSPQPIPPGPDPSYTMDIDAYKTFYAPERSEFSWGSSNVWVTKCLKEGTKFNFSTSKLSDPDNNIRFNGISPDEPSEWETYTDIGFIFDEAKAISGSLPPYIGFETISCNNIYISISDPGFYERKFYSWTTNLNTQKIFEHIEKVSIYLEIDSNLAKISDPENTWIKQFYNTDKIKEFVIKDLATEKLTDKTIWNNKFKLDDIDKIFLI